MRTKSEHRSPAQRMIDDASSPGREPSPANLRRLVALVSRSRALTGLLDADGTPLYLSPSAVELHTGVRAKRPSEAKDVANRVHPDDFEALAEGFEEALLHPEVPIPIRYRTRHVDGSWRIIEGTYTNLLADPDIAGIMLDVLDVTDRADAEAALRASQARNQHVIDSLAAGIILSDAEGRVVACNPAAEALLGLDGTEILSRSAQDERWALIRRDGSPIAPEDGPASRTRTTGQPCRDVVMGVQRPNGYCTWISANSVVIESDADGHPELVAVSLTDISDLVESSAELEQNEQRFRTLIARSSDVVTVIDLDLHIRYVSGAVEEILGYRVDELVGRSAVELIHPDDLEEAFDSVARTLTPDRVPEPLEIRLLHARGHWIHLEALGTNLLDDPLVAGIAVNLRDISDRRRIEATLRDAQTRFEEAFQHAPIGMAMVDADGSFFRVNPAFCRMLGFSEAELLELSFGDLTHPEDLDENVDLHTRAYDGSVDSYVLDKRYRRKPGDWIWCRVHVTVVKDSDGTPIYSLGQIVDVTERRHFEERLAYEATHDGLTGLPLRNLLVDHLELALAGARRRTSEVAVLFIDLDHFKRVNDSLGHSAGDELLVSVARRLSAAVRDVDTAGRFGGDEFVIVCPEVEGAAGALVVAERIRAELERPFCVRGTEVFVGASVGVVVADGDADPGTLLKHADIAAYRAKERGRNRAELFDENLRSSVATRIDTESAFRRGLDTGELMLFYQPVISVRTGAITGFEALVRWDRAGHGIVLPAEFLAIAEETGLIVPMGIQLLKLACAQIAAWHGRFPDGSSPWVSVNLSAGQLAQTDLVEEVATILAESGASPRSLCIEITETLLMQDTPATIETLRRLRDLGVSLAIDDFGTGYSSLSYLRRLPVTVLKIDRSFVLELGLDPQGATIVASVIDLAHALGMECVAEGVENAVHLTTLARLGCDEMQGFLFSPAVPPDAATALLGRQFVTPAPASRAGR
jgi:diguanylate cyclase (GGDEF)-like protein/PAS domain S-box-containing protein